MKRLIVLCLLLLQFNSCSWISKQADLEPIKIPLGLEEPKPVKLAAIEFYVVTPENATEQFQAVQKDNQAQALFCLSEPGYHHMADNFQKIQEYMVLEKQVLQSYKAYYEPKALDK